MDDQPVGHLAGTGECFGVFVLYGVVCLLTFLREGGLGILDKWDLGLLGMRRLDTFGNPGNLKWTNRVEIWWMI
jgi:hypothetical protein